MEKREKPLLLIKIIVFVLLLIGLLALTNSIFIKQDIKEKYEGFYKEKEDFDILFFGSSRVLDAFQPMELWDNYNIRSYNMAQHAEALSRNYWALRNALEHKNTNLVVMDVSYFYGGNVYVDDEESRAYYHKQIDHMPLSKTKIEAINQNVPKEIRGEYLFPFILYHSRWNEVSLSDIHVRTNIMKGAEIRTNIMPQEKFNWNQEELSEIFSPVGLHLDEIITLCHEKNVNLLFICMPCAENAGVYSTLNHFRGYFADRGIDYINISEDEDFLNYHVDFSDDSHVNVGGSYKLTDYIGKYYSDKYEIVEINAKTEKEWNDILAKYKEKKEALILSAKDSPELLFEITYCDDDYYVEIECNKEMYDKYNVAEYYKDAVVNDSCEGMDIYVYRSSDSSLIAGSFINE